MRTARLLEIYNGHPTVPNLGGGDWPGMDAAWDALLTRGRRLYGIAVDDAHHFKGDFKYTTRFIGAGGRVLATDRTLAPSHRPCGTETDVRAKVVSSSGSAAWVQPTFTSRWRGDAR